MKLKFTDTARSQLLNAAAHIYRDNPVAAKRFKDKCLQRLERLKLFPESGRPLPEYPDSIFREVLVAPYRFFYKVQEKTITIVAMWHSAQIPADPKT